MKGSQDAYDGSYDDIIHLPHPLSAKHPRMSVSDRAAQFSPFAALTGYDAAIRETARLTEHKIYLDEDAKTALDGKLHMAAAQKGNHWAASVTYFKADESKDGGSYETVTGIIKKIDSYERMVVFVDGRRIAVDDIYEIETGPEV